MKKCFGKLPDGSEAFLYTIQGGQLRAEISDYGATIVKLFVPDKDGKVADVVLGFDDPNEYTKSGTYFGAVVGRNANRVGGAKFTLNNRTYGLDPNDNGVNNLHSGFAPYKNRLWTVERHDADSIRLSLRSPDGDQGFPGNATIHVTYTIDADNGLRITYDGICDKDTVFNMTNHAYFNLAGHDHPEKAMAQTLSMPARFFTVCDAASIPTGENRPVDGTPFDFRVPKPIGRDINEEYDALKLQGGYDHNWEVFCNPCATLTDPDSGRTMAVYTDCPGIQFYAGNYLKGTGKGGVEYGARSGIALETQYFPNAVNQPSWKQPLVKAGQKYSSTTTYKFTW